MYPYSKQAVKPSLVFNQDGMALLANDDQKKPVLRYDKRARATLKSQNFGVKTLSTSAASELVEMTSSVKSSGHTLGSITSSKKPRTPPQHPSVATVDAVPTIRGCRPTPIFGTTAPPTQADKEVPIVRIRRDGRVENPIVTVPTGNNFPPRCRSMQRRGIKLDAMSVYPGKWLVAILTITDRNIKKGFRLYKMSDRLWVVFRALKVVEIDLAIEKEAQVFLPAMEREREYQIRQYIENYNSLRELKLSIGQSVTYPILKREDVDMSEWKMLKTLDGCGPELNALSALINGLNEELDTLESEMDEPDDSTDDFTGTIDADEEEEEEDDREDVPNQDDDEAGFAQYLRRHLELILPAFVLILKFLSQSTMMKQPHDVAKCKSLNFK